MANVKIIFSGTEQSSTQEHELQLFKNHRGEIFISIATDELHDEAFICLDKDTAMALSKELLKQISSI